MSDDPSAVSCSEFQKQLLEMFESDSDVENHPHLRNCHFCRALLQDLETIREEARRLFGDEV